MSTPRTAINRWDLSLTYGEFSLLANQKKFIGLRVLPAVPVGEQAANFRKIKIASLLGKTEDTRRNADGTYKRDDYEWDKDNYATEDHGVEERVDDRNEKIYRSLLRAETIKTRRAINRVLMAYEQEVAAAVFNSATWTGASLTTDVATTWKDKQSADPLADIDDAKFKVQDACGEAANALVVTDLDLLNLVRSDRVEDLLKYSGRADPSNLSMLDGLKQLLQIEHLLVAKGYHNTADEGQAATLSRLWGTGKAMVCHINPDFEDIEDPQPTLGFTAMWTEENAEIPGADDNVPGVIVEEYREENRRGGVIRARCDYQVKILHKEAGHLLTGLDDAVAG